MNRAVRLIFQVVSIVLMALNVLARHVMVARVLIVVASLMNLLMDRGGLMDGFVMDRSNVVYRDLDLMNRSFMVLHNMSILVVKDRCLDVMGSLMMDRRSSMGNLNFVMSRDSMMLARVVLGDGISDVSRLLMMNNSLVLAVIWIDYVSHWCVVRSTDVWVLTMLTVVIDYGLRMLADVRMLSVMHSGLFVD